MRENVGATDALVRTVIGGALIYVAVRELEPRWVRPAALLTLGSLLVESAVTRVCPVNHLLGLDTRGSPVRQRATIEGRAVGIDARPPTLVHSEWGARAADLDLPYDDVSASQRPPSDS
jgi:hypothetical protein